MIDWGFDLPEGLGEHIAALDIEHDGISEVAGGVIDLQHDGIPESVGGVIDLDHDGIPEATGGVLDVGHDGIAESLSGVIDLDHDGIPEGSMASSHLDSFLNFDLDSVQPAAVASYVSELHLPDPFATGPGL